MDKVTLKELKEIIPRFSFEEMKLKGFYKDKTIDEWRFFFKYKEFKDDPLLVALVTKKTFINDYKYTGCSEKFFDSLFRLQFFPGIFTRIIGTRKNINEMSLKDLKKSFEKAQEISKKVPNEDKGYWMQNEKISFFGNYFGFDYLWGEKDFEVIFNELDDFVK